MHLLSFVVRNRNNVIVQPKTGFICASLTHLVVFSHVVLEKQIKVKEIKDRLNGGASTQF